MSRRSKRTRKQRDFYQPGGAEAKTDQILNRKRVSLSQFGKGDVESGDDAVDSEEEFRPKKRAKASAKKPKQKAIKKGDHGELFVSLSSKNIALVQVAREWLERFRQNQTKATGELLNFGKDPSSKYK